MTREEKLADDVWFYINRFVAAMASGSSLRAAADASKELDRALLKAMRSKKGRRE